jgi:hypothetical protein
VGPAGKVALAGGVLVVAYVVVSRMSTARAPASGATPGNKPSDIATVSGLFSAGAALINSLRTPTTPSPPTYGGSPNLWDPSLSLRADQQASAAQFRNETSSADAERDLFS